MKTWIEISKAALTHNFQQFESRLPNGVRFMAVVKANAYGHGLVGTVKILDKVRSKRELWFGVDSIDEAVTLRKAGIKKPILVLGYSPLSSLPLAIKHDLRLTVYNLETVMVLGRFARRANKIAKIHIKIDTGTTRQGVGDEEIIKFARKSKKIKNIEIEGLGTHFANIEDTTSHSYASYQLKRFNKNAQKLKRIGVNITLRHCAASAAALLFPETHFNMVRVGISLYGLWPSIETKLTAAAKNNKIELKPVMAWKTIVAQVKTVKAGTGVSYGLTERVIRKTKVAVLPVGYFDGYDRALSSVGNVLVRGVRCKILGRVCMNMLMIDVTDVPGVKLEDEAVLIGRQKKDHISAEELAQKIGTINYEVVARINPNQARIIV